MIERKKVVSVRVNENLHERFLQTVAKFTVTTTSGVTAVRERYHVKFPDREHWLHDKYTVADLLEEAMAEFIEKYGSQSRQGASV